MSMFKGISKLLSKSALAGLAVCVLSASNACAFPWNELPAFRYICKSPAGTIAQFAFDPQSQPPLSVKIGDGIIDRLTPSHVTAHPDFNYSEKDEYGYDKPVKSRPIILQLIDAGPYGLLQGRNFDTGWILMVEKDGRPSGTGSGRESYNCIQSSTLGIE